MAMVCPDCEEMVNREALALHPRYCVVRAKSLSQLIYQRIDHRENTSVDPMARPHTVTWLDDSGNP